ncbi:ubiquitin carboxyl-terminal hydrolase 23 [Dendrobium catenatum]|uniref:Ubiquitin carboxyl-terminal hydrolase n=1 Tax=Dendrobium catenatum TaxID=906689 RepID=A0A2I0X4J4_9ASPA|nr:ubiquitin carboxyl-terminal hydrolase 23 [Dendrobium catenatum]PKU82820.1 Ubiquitin carboxyl-terminal hydrolase 23 [Dendrobium catenatum]
MDAAAEKAVAAMSAAGQPFFSRRIEFHPARRPYNGVPISSGDFRLEILNPGSADEQREASGSGTGPAAAETAAHGKRSTGGEFHEHGLDPELSFRINFQRIGAGLENLGNTCYLNSVLQCLTYTEPFAAYLQSGKHKSTCRAAGFCAMCALQNHVMDALQSTGKILRPFHLVRNLRCISRSFRNSRQEDAHEYMVNLLESMHKCCLPSGVQSESPSAYEKSLVHKIFGGQLRSQVKCMQCSYCSNKFDPFLDLSLEIVRVDSLRKAFAHFTATEQLDGGERQYQCQRCKEKVQALKQLTIHKAPYVLAIHLKRFGSSIHGQKINKKVEFEPTLDVKPFVSGVHDGELKYTLYGVLVHAGWSTHSGHYFCYVRTSAGLWYSLDDNHVSQVSEKTVLSREAYMLFYVRNRTPNIKRSVEDKLNANISANSTGNKEAPLGERKLDTKVYSSITARNDAIVHDPLASVNDSSRQHLFKNQEPLVQKNCHTTTEGSCLQTNDDVSSNGFHKTVLPMNRTELPVSVKSQLPSFDTKRGNVNKNPLDNATQQKMETSSAPSDNDDKRPLSPSNVMNGPTKEATRAAFMDHLVNDPDIKRCSISLKGQNGRERILKFLDAKPAESLKLNTANSSAQGETSTVKEMDGLLDGSHQVMSKKQKIPFIAEYSYFGRKQLFFMSLRLRKTKKKKTKKQHQNFRNKIKRRLVNTCTDSQGASTSETFRTVSVDSIGCFEKDLPSTLKKKFKREEFVKSGNDSITCENPGNSKQSSRSSGCIEGKQNVKIKNDEDENILQNCSVSLLKASLREAPVAGWDADDLLTPQIKVQEDRPKRHIGYLLDEWDEEYDKGKRKKLKSRQWFDGPNPFQKTADLKTQQRMMKVVQTSFGKEPLRI